MLSEAGRLVSWPTGYLPTWIFGPVSLARALESTHHSAFSFSTEGRITAGERHG